MIQESISFIEKEVAAITGFETIVGHAHALEEKTNNESCIHITLVNVREESTLKNLPNFVREAGALKRKEPPIYLNLHLLFIANASDYETSLQLLSGIAECFQSTPFFEAGNAKNNITGFPSKVERLVFELFNLNLEQLNHFWGVNGGKYYPSLLYKVRMVPVEKAGPAQDGPEISDITLEGISIKARNQ